MSILIKGIKVHRGSCWDCPCLDGEYGECNVLEKDVHYIDKKDCPLIELPAHGDLIDRDVLLESAGLCVCDFGTPDEQWRPDRDWHLHINHAPVVIPAERSEE